MATRDAQRRDDPSRDAKRYAGHQEIHGETIAKFEFFEAGWNPYSRYLDVDKVDLILRRRNGDSIIYHEVQVKFGRLYDVGEKWARKMFDVTSWRQFKLDEFSSRGRNLYIAYVLVHPSHTYQQDMFIFPVSEFDHLVKSAVRNNSKKGPLASMFIGRMIGTNRWFLRRKSRFDAIGPDTTIEVTKYRRNFGILEGER